MKKLVVVMLIVSMILSGCGIGKWKNIRSYTEYQPQNERYIKKYAMRARYKVDAIAVQVQETVFAEVMERTVDTEEEFASTAQKAPIVPAGLTLLGIYGTVESYESYNERYKEWQNDPYRVDDDEPSPWLPLTILVLSGALIYNSFSESPTGNTREVVSPWQPSDKIKKLQSQGAAHKKVHVMLAENARSVLSVDEIQETDETGKVYVAVAIKDKNYISESSPKWESRTLENTHEEYFYATVSIPEEDVSYEVRLGPYKNTNIFNR